MVQPGSSLTSFEQLDTAGNTIITAKGGAYSLWLERNIQHATLIQETGAAVKERFVAEKLTAMAGLRPALVNDKLRDEGYGVLDGHYAMVEQASGVPKAKGEEAFAWLREWIEEVKANGLVASLTEEFGVTENLLVRKRLSILEAGLGREWAGSGLPWPLWLRKNAHAPFQLTWP